MQNQAVSYGIGKEYGYAWDFLKLLHFNAPILLFVACIPGFATYLSDLETTLIKCACDYQHLLKDRDLHVVLLPKAAQTPLRIRLGRAEKSGGLKFWDLGSGTAASGDLTSQCAIVATSAEAAI